MSTAAPDSRTSSTPNSQDSDSTVAPANAALPAAIAVLEAINTGDLSRLSEFVTADFLDHSAPFPLPPGPEGYARILGFVHEQLRIRYHLEDLIATEDRIVIRALAHGEGVESVHGPGSTGAAYSMQTIHIFRTEGERLAEHWGVRDELGAMRQMGLVTRPDAT